jgi:hypothetical protein
MASRVIPVQQVPRTKLWRHPDADADSRDVGSYVIVLECECGAAIEYPGHPDAVVTVGCGGCGKRWTIATDLALVDKTEVLWSQL